MSKVTLSTKTAAGGPNQHQPIRCVDGINRSARNLGDGRSVSESDGRLQSTTTIPYCSRRIYATILPHVFQAVELDGSRSINKQQHCTWRLNLGDVVVSLLLDQEPPRPDGNIKPAIECAELALILGSLLGSKQSVSQSPEWARHMYTKWISFTRSVTWS